MERTTREQVFPCSSWKRVVWSRYLHCNQCTSPHQINLAFPEGNKACEESIQAGEKWEKESIREETNPCFRGRGRVDLGVKERSWAWEQLGGCSIVLSSSCYPNLLKSAINKFSIIEIHFYCDNTCCLSWLISYFILLLPSPLTSFCLASWQRRKREAGCLVADLGQPIPILALNHSVNEHLSTDMQVPVASTSRW